MALLQKSISDNDEQAAREMVYGALKERPKEMWPNYAAMTYYEKFPRIYSDDSVQFYAGKALYYWLEKPESTEAYLKEMDIDEQKRNQMRWTIDSVYMHYISSPYQLDTLAKMVDIGRASEKEDTLTLLFAGDVMQHGPNIKSAFDPATKSFDYKPQFAYIKPLISQADLAFANLETTLAGPPYKGYPQFSAPDELIDGLKYAGFDVLVTANNHSMDKGIKGLNRTIEVLDKKEIPHTGTFKDELSRENHYPLLLEKKGFRISLLNYTYGTNGIPVRAPAIVNLIDSSLIKVDLEKAKTQDPDAIIVFYHWGDEYQSLPNKEQKQMEEFALKHGADLVIGAHPHVVQPMEWKEHPYKTGKFAFTAYSLGNFISNQRNRYRWGGTVAQVTLVKKSFLGSSAYLQQAAFAPFWVQKQQQPNLAYYLFPTTEYKHKLYMLNEDSTDFLLFQQDVENQYSTHNQAVKEMVYVQATGQWKMPELLKEEGGDQRVDYRIIIPVSSVAPIQNNLINRWSIDPTPISDQFGIVKYQTDVVEEFEAAAQLVESLRQAGYPHAYAIPVVDGIPVKYEEVANYY